MGQGVSHKARQGVAVLLLFAATKAQKLLSFSLLFLSLFFFFFLLFFVLLCVDLFYVPLPEKHLVVIMPTDLGGDFPRAISDVLPHLSRPWDGETVGILLDLIMH